MHLKKISLESFTVRKIHEYKIKTPPLLGMRWGWCRITCFSCLLLLAVPAKPRHWVVVSNFNLLNSWERQGYWKNTTIFFTLRMIEYGQRFQCFFFHKRRHFILRSEGDCKAAAVASIGHSELLYIQRKQTTSKQKEGSKEKAAQGLEMNHGKTWQNFHVICQEWRCLPLL